MKVVALVNDDDTSPLREPTVGLESALDRVEMEFAIGCNEPDLDDVPEAVREALTVHTVSDVREVLSLALEPATVAATVAA